MPLGSGQLVAARGGDRAARLLQPAGGELVGLVDRARDLVVDAAVARRAGACSRAAARAPRASARARRASRARAGRARRPRRRAPRRRARRRARRAARAARASAASRGNHGTAVNNSESARRRAPAISETIDEHREREARASGRPVSRSSRSAATIATKTGPTARCRAAARRRARPRPPSRRRARRCAARGDRRGRCGWAQPAPRATSASVAARITAPRPSKPGLRPAGERLDEEHREVGDAEAAQHDRLGRRHAVAARARACRRVNHL